MAWGGVWQGEGWGGVGVDQEGMDRGMEGCLEVVLPPSTKFHVGAAPHTPLHGPAPSACLPLMKIMS